MDDAKETSRRWWVLAAMGGILGIILLDETVVGVALPTIQTELAMSEVGSHWVVNIYMLVLAGLAAVAGKLGDLFGHKRFVILGLLIFGLASVACGFAQSNAWLVTARALQGVGAAIIFPTSLALVTIAFPPEKRGLALGIYGAIGTVFLALGPLVGGVLTDYASWRWIFWINPFIVLVVALVVMVVWSDPPQPPTRPELDLKGAATLIAGLFLLVFAIMEGPGWGWTDPIIVTLILLGITLLFLFVQLERRLAEPLIDVRLFTNATFFSSNLVIFWAQFAKMAIFVFIAVYLQDVMGMSPLLAGLALLPAVAPQPFTAAIVGRITDHYGARRPALVGLWFNLAGFVIIAAAMVIKPYALMLFGLLALGLCMAFLFVPPQHAVFGAVQPESRGEAGGIAMSSQLMGATIGVAVCSTVFSMTSSYVAIVAVNALFAALILLIAWITLERPLPAKPA